MRTRALSWFLAVGTLLASSPLQAVPVHQWSGRFGGDLDQYGLSIAADAAGNFIVGGPYVIAEDAPEYLSQIFVMKLDANGNQLWSKRFGNLLTAGGSIATDALGNIVVTGQFTGTADFGGETLTSAGSSDIFVAKLDTNGNHLWSRRFGDVSYDGGNDVAVDASRNVVVTGFFQGTVDFGGGLLTSAGASDIFVAKFDADGAHVWARRFGDVSYDYGNDIAVDASRNVVVTGSFQGTVDFGGGLLTSAGALDIFVAKFDADGAHVWARRFGDGDDQIRSSVAADDSRDIVVAGSFQGAVDFGGGLLTSAGVDDIFVAKLDSDGGHLWSRRFGDVSYDYGNDVAVDASRNVVVTGSFQGTVDFGGGLLTSAGGPDIFIMKLAPDGAHVWARHFGDSEYQSAKSVLADGSGNVVLTGAFASTVNFGGETLTSVRSYDDIFVAKFVEQALSVLITRFEATAVEGAARVMWEVWSDEAIESYTLYRRDDTRPQAIVIAQGPFDPTTRSYIDASVEPGRTYHYELLIHARGGDDIRSLVATLTVPEFEAVLGQNFPNPFEPSTTIEYTLSKRSSAVLGIYDATGRLIVRLDQGVRDAGTHRDEWNGRDADGRLVGSGVYFYRLEGAPSVAARKMVLMR